MQKNNHNRPLACAVCEDSEGKNLMTQTSLLVSENEVAFVFTIVSIEFLHGIFYLRSVSVFVSDGNNKIIATGCRFILVGVFDLLTRSTLCYWDRITLPMTKALKGDDASNHMVRKVLLFSMKIASRYSTVKECQFYRKQMTDWLDGDLESKIIISSFLRKSSECLTIIRAKVFCIFYCYY